MNRKVPLFAVLTLVGATALAAPALAAPQLQLAVMGGLASPMGEFGEDAKTGFNLGAGLYYGFTDMLALGAEVGWHSVEHEGVGETEELPPGSGVFYTLDEDRFSILHVGANLRLTMAAPDSPVRPYALVGLGIYNVKENYEYTVDDGVTSTTFTDEDDEADGFFEQIGSRLGATFGLGAMFRASERIGIGIDARYHLVTLDENETLTPLSGESSLSFASIQAALTFDLGGGGGGY